MFWFNEFLFLSIGPFNWKYTKMHLFGNHRIIYILTGYREWMFSREGEFIKTTSLGLLTSVSPYPVQ